MRKNNCKFNVDALKFCLTSDRLDLYENLISEAEADLIERPDYSLYIIEHREQSIDFNVTTKDGYLLGILTITKQRHDKFDGKHYFTVDNQALYTPFMCKDTNLLVFMDYVFVNEGLCVNNVTRIEISLDTPKNIITRLDKLIKNPELSMLYNNKFVDMDERLHNAFYIYGRTRIKRDRLPSLYFKGCHITVKAYNKMQEIQEMSNKYYILDYNGFKKDKLFRLEVTLDREAWLNSIPELAGVPYSSENWLAYLLDEASRCVIWCNAISRVLRFKKHGQELNLLQQLGIL